jgi:hypothetical protein
MTVLNRDQPLPLCSDRKITLSLGPPFEGDLSPTTPLENPVFFRQWADEIVLGRPMTGVGQISLNVVVQQKDALAKASGIKSSARHLEPKKRN